MTKFCPLLAVAVICCWIWSSSYSVVNGYYVLSKNYGGHWENRNGTVEFVLPRNFHIVGKGNRLVFPNDFKYNAVFGSHGYYTDCRTGRIPLPHSPGSIRPYPFTGCCCKSPKEEEEDKNDDKSEDPHRSKNEENTTKTDGDGDFDDDDGDFDDLHHGKKSSSKSRNKGKKSGKGKDGSKAKNSKDRHHSDENTAKTTTTAAATTDGGTDFDDDDFDDLHHGDKSSSKSQSKKFSSKSTYKKSAKRKNMSKAKSSSTGNQSMKTGKNNRKNSGKGKSFAGSKSAKGKNFKKKDGKDKSNGKGKSNGEGNSSKRKTSASKNSKNKSGKAQNSKGKNFTGNNAKNSIGKGKSPQGKKNSTAKNTSGQANSSTSKNTSGQANSSNGKGTKGKTLKSKNSRNKAKSSEGKNKNGEQTAKQSGTATNYKGKNGKSSKNSGKGKAKKSNGKSSKDKPNSKMNDGKANAKTSTGKNSNGKANSSSQAAGKNRRSKGGTEKQSKQKTMPKKSSSSTKRKDKNTNSSGKSSSSSSSSSSKEKQNKNHQKSKKSKSKSSSSEGGGGESYGDYYYAGMDDDDDYDDSGFDDDDFDDGYENESTNQPGSSVTETFHNEDTTVSSSLNRLPSSTLETTAETSDAGSLSTVTKFLVDELAEASTVASPTKSDEDEPDATVSTPSTTPNEKPTASKISSGTNEPEFMSTDAPTSGSVIITDAEVSSGLMSTVPTSLTEDLIHQATEPPESMSSTDAPTSGSLVTTNAEASSGPMSTVTTSLLEELNQKVTTEESPLDSPENPTSWGDIDLEVNETTQATPSHLTNETTASGPKETNKMTTENAETDHSFMMSTVSRSFIDELKDASTIASLPSDTTTVNVDINETTEKMSTDILEFESTAKPAAMTDSDQGTINPETQQTPADDQHDKQTNTMSPIDPTTTPKTDSKINEATELANEATSSAAKDITIDQENENTGGGFMSTVTKSLDEELSEAPTLSPLGSTNKPTSVPDANFGETTESSDRSETEPNESNSKPTDSPPANKITAEDVTMDQENENTGGGFMSTVTNSLDEELSEAPTLSPLGSTNKPTSVPDANFGETTESSNTSETEASESNSKPTDYPPENKTTAEDVTMDQENESTGGGFTSTVTKSLDEELSEASTLSPLGSTNKPTSVPDANFGETTESSDKSETEAKESNSKPTDSPPANKTTAEDVTIDQENENTGGGFMSTVTKSLDEELSEAPTLSPLGSTNKPTSVPDTNFGETTESYDTSETEGKESNWKPTDFPLAHKITGEYVTIEQENESTGGGFMSTVTKSLDEELSEALTLSALDFTDKPTSVPESDFRETTESSDTSETEGKESNWKPTDSPPAPKITGEYVTIEQENESTNGVFTSTVTKSLDQEHSEALNESSDTSGTEVTESNSKPTDSPPAQEITASLKSTLPNANSNTTTEGPPHLEATSVENWSSRTTTTAKSVTDQTTEQQDTTVPSTKSATEPPNANPNTTTEGPPHLEATSVENWSSRTTTTAKSVTYQTTEQQDTTVSSTKSATEPPNVNPNTTTESPPHLEATNVENWSSRTTTTAKSVTEQTTKQPDTIASTKKSATEPPNVTVRVTKRPKTTKEVTEKPTGPITTKRPKPTSPITKGPRTTKRSKLPTTNRRTSPPATKGKTNTGKSTTKRSSRKTTEKNHHYDNNQDGHAAMKCDRICTVDHHLTTAMRRFGYYVSKKTETFLTENYGLCQGEYYLIGCNKDIRKTMYIYCSVIHDHNFWSITYSGRRPTETVQAGPYIYHYLIDQKPRCTPAAKS